MTPKNSRKDSNSLRLVFLSDTHELHREIDVPSGDILFFAGDATMFSRSAAAALDFDEWLGELPFRHRIVTWGNHDGCFAPGRPTSIRLRNATVLINDVTRVAGLNVWGSPVTPLMNGAFTMPSEMARRKLYETIPADTDILLTHTPAFGILDGLSGSNVHEGCAALLDAVRRIQPLLHCCGHVHAGYGVRQTPTTTFVNASLLGPDGDIANRPIVTDIPERSSSRPR